MSDHAGQPSGHIWLGSMQETLEVYCRPTEEHGISDAFHNFGHSRLACQWLKRGQRCPRSDGRIWDKLAIHEPPPVQRQVYRQNSTFSERSTGQDLRPLLGRLQTVRF